MIQDPTKQEMVSFLQSQFGSGLCDFDLEGAIYWFANHYHGGQWSNLYSALSTSPFNPGPICRGPEKGTMEEMCYEALECEFAEGVKPRD